MGESLWRTIRSVQWSPRWELRWGFDTPTHRSVEHCPRRESAQESSSNPKYLDFDNPFKMFLFTCLPHKSSSKHPSAKMIVWLKLYEEKRLGKVFYLKMTSDDKKDCFIALWEETRGAGRSSWKRSPGLLRMLTLTRMPVRLPPSHVMNANMSQRLTRGWRSTKAKHTSLSRTCEDHQQTTL